MRRMPTEKKIQEATDQIRNAVCILNSGAHLLTMIHTEGLVLVIDQKGYSVSDPNGKQLSIHRYFDNDPLQDE